VTPCMAGTMPPTTILVKNIPAVGDRACTRRWTGAARRSEPRLVRMAEDSARPAT
jgi:hypothetical protein